MCVRLRKSCAPAGWWFDPDWIINELGINSTITSPAHEEMVTLDSQKEYVVRGYAYSSAPLFLTSNSLRLSRQGSRRLNMRMQHPSYSTHSTRGHAFPTAARMPHACVGLKGPVESLRDCLVCAGGTKILRCEVSLDDGKTWRCAKIQRFAPPNSAGKHWAWVHYSLSVPVGES